jgi:hypothetical protein
MTLKSQNRFTSILDDLAKGMSYSGACQSNGVSYRQFFDWVRSSQKPDCDETLMVDFLGSRVPFFKAVNASRTMLHHEARSRFERRSLLGHDEPIFFSGMPTWQPDKRTVGWTEEEREAYGFRRDGLLEVNGSVVQNVAHVEPPVAAVLRLLEVAFPDEYIPATKSTVTSTINGVVGLQIAARQFGPPAIPAPPPRPPELEILPDDLDDILGELAEPAGTPEQVEPDEVEPDEPAPPPVEPTQSPPVDPVLGAPPATIPAGWRTEWDRLQQRRAPK